MRVKDIYNKNPTLKTDTIEDTRVMVLHLGVMTPLRVKDPFTGVAYQIFTL